MCLTSQGQVTLGGLPKDRNNLTRNNLPVTLLGGFNSTDLMLEVPKQASILYVR